MVRKDRNLAGFGEVAGKGENNNDNININNNDDNNIISEIIKEDKKKKLTGIYFEPEVEAALDRAASGKKGAKSKIVNAAVKKLLQEENLL